MKIIRIGLKICVWGGIIMIIALTLILSASYIMGPPPIDIGATTVFYDQEGNELHPQEKQQTRSEEHTSELQSRGHLVCRLLLEKKNTNYRSSGRAGLAEQ